MGFTAKSSILTQKLDSGLQKLRHKAYCKREQILARVAAERRILFSERPDWEDNIREGFAHTNHTVHFEKFTPRSVQGYDLVVPLTMDAVRFLSEHRHLLPDNPLPITSAHAVAVCDDKVRFHQALTEAGFSYALPPVRGDLGFPYILKKKIDEWGQSCRVIHTPEDEAQYAGLLQDPAYFRQRMVVGADEYATHMVVRDGKLVRALNIRYSFDTPTPVKGPDQPRWVRTCPCPHLPLFTDILNAIGYEGLCCFNYKLDEKGQPLVFEINPRFGNSLSPYFFGFVRDLCR